VSRSAGVRCNYSPEQHRTCECDYTVRSPYTVRTVSMSSFTLQCARATCTVAIRQRKQCTKSKGHSATGVEITSPTCTAPREELSYVFVVRALALEPRIGFRLFRKSRYRCTNPYGIDIMLRTVCVIGLLLHAVDFAAGVWGPGFVCDGVNTSTPADLALAGKHLRVGAFYQTSMPTVGPTGTFDCRCGGGKRCILRI